MTDSNAGWRSYAAYLEWLAEDEAAQKALAFDRMCRRWALGSEQFKKDLLKEYEEKVTAAQLNEEALLDVTLPPREDSTTGGYLGFRSCSILRNPLFPAAGFSCAVLP